MAKAVDFKSERGTTMGNQGTTYRLTQFARIIAVFSEALAIVVTEMDPKTVLSALNNKSEKLKSFIRMLFTALMTDNELGLVK